VLGYMSVIEAAKKWDSSERWVQVLCSQNRIQGAVRFGRSWAIPKDAPKPADGRLKSERKKTKSQPESN
jgi:hypothetical protein